MKDYDKEIKKLEKEIEYLKEEKFREEKIPTNVRLAEILHSKLCTWNHTDGCGWYYESWDKPGYSRSEYLKKANAMLSEMTFEAAIKVIKFI